jgi:hypothetical protein
VACRLMRGLGGSLGRQCWSPAPQTNKAYCDELYPDEYQEKPQTLPQGSRQSDSAKRDPWRLRGYSVKGPTTPARTMTSPSKKWIRWCSDGVAA